MSKINSRDDLRSAILALEVQQSDEKRLLREQFHIVGESIKPINLIKSAFREVSESPDLPSIALSTPIGIMVGYFSKMVFEGTSSNPFRRLLGAFLQFTVANAVANSPGTVNSLGRGFLKISSRLLSVFRN